MGRGCGIILLYIRDLLRTLSDVIYVVLLSVRRALIDRDGRILEVLDSDTVRGLRLLLLRLREEVRDIRAIGGGLIDLILVGRDLRLIGMDREVFLDLRAVLRCVRLRIRDVLDLLLTYRDSITVLLAANDVLDLVDVADDRRDCLASVVLLDVLLLDVGTDRREVEVDVRRYAPMLRGLIYLVILDYDLAYICRLLTDDPGA